MTKHPFLNIQEATEQGFQGTTPPQLNMLVTTVANNATVPGVPLIRFDRVNPSVSFASLDEVEDFLLGFLTNNSPKAVTENLRGGALPFVIQRASAKIAHRTKRGMANRVLVHPDDHVDFIASCLGTGNSMFMAVANGAQLGRCTHVGMLNNALDVWTHPSVPRGKQIVLYNQRLDGAAATIQTHTGWHLALMPPGSAAQAQDYAIVVS